MLYFKTQYRKYKICWNVFIKLDLKLNDNGHEVVMIYRNPCSNQEQVIATKSNQPEQSRWQISMLITLTLPHLSLVKHETKMKIWNL